MAQSSQVNVGLFLLAGILAALALSPREAQAGDKVLWYTGNAGIVGDVAELDLELRAAGASDFVTTDVWPSNLMDFRVIFVAMPRSPFAANQTAALHSFLEAGGVAVLMGDSSLILPEHVDTLNGILAGLGSQSRFLSAGGFEDGCGKAAHMVDEHPFAAGVDLVGYAWTGSIAPGPDTLTLLAGQRAQQVFLAAEENLLLTADVNVFTGPCAPLADNRVLYRNLFGAWCDGDHDGHLNSQAVCNGDDCADADASIYGGAVESCDLIDSDCDGSLVDEFADSDADGHPNCVEADLDSDGVLNELDPVLDNPFICGDNDDDGCDDCSIGVDGFGPASDVTPDNDGTDTDHDGLCDLGDQDDDNDSIIDSLDPAINDPKRCGDSDNDQCDDCAIGTDGFSPLSDVHTEADGLDTDADGRCDLGDLDRDNDGVANEADVAPLNPSRCSDVEDDGCDDCSAGQGFAPANDGTDTDHDGLCDAGDADDDNDGVADSSDPLTSDPKVCGDADHDTCDDCTLGVDAFGPASDVTPANDGADTDQDGLCDAGDADDDNDGVTDAADLSSRDPDLCGDSDLDLCDDCAVGVDDLGLRSDSKPEDDGADRDHDGLCDLSDTDTDNDGLSDTVESLLGTDPYDADSDDDGALDGEEPNYSGDNDGDGLINALDIDSDSDGLLDGTELGVGDPHPDTNNENGGFIPDSDPKTTTDPLEPDSDQGGVPDGAEDADHDGLVDDGESDPNDPTDDLTPLDSDHDRATDAEEGAAGTDPYDADSDDDGVLDGEEPNWSTDANADGRINALDPDSDNDGLFDGTELGVTSPNPDTDLAAGTFVADSDPSTTTSPIDLDTDNGGVPDGIEDANRNGRVDDGELDPNDPSDDRRMLFAIVDDGPIVLTPVTPDQPAQDAALDYILVDTECACSTVERSAGQPWGTFLVSSGVLVLLVGLRRRS